MSLRLLWEDGVEDRRERRRPLRVLPLRRQRRLPIRRRPRLQQSTGPRRSTRWLRLAVCLRAVITQLEDFSARVRKGLEEISWVERRHIIRTLVARVEIDENGATIVYRLPSLEPTETKPTEPSNGGGSTDRSQSCQLR